MSVRFGTNPIAWSNDDLLELGAKTPLETCLSEARGAGFEGIELGNKFPRTAEKLRPIMEAHDIELVGGWYSTNLLERSVEDEIAACQDHLTLLKQMGCSVFICCETTGAVHGDRTRPVSSRPVIDDAAAWARFGERMGDFSAYIRDQGLRPAYHHHMGTVVETTDEIHRFMEVTGKNAGLLLDAGHVAFGGGDPVSLARAYADRITHVHCKDIRLPVRDAIKDRDASFLDAVVDGVYTVPGDGQVDFAGVLGAVAEAGYTGWLVVEAEQDPEVANPKHYAELGYRNLVQLAEAAGLT